MKTKNIHNTFYCDSIRVSVIDGMRDNAHTKTKKNVVVQHFCCLYVHAFLGSTEIGTKKKKSTSKFDDQTIYLVWIILKWDRQKLRDTIKYQIFY